jgi:hypothetical protein
MWRSTNGSDTTPVGVSITQHSITDSDNMASSLTWNRVVNVDDSGTYTCITVTKNGTSNATLELNILGE